MCQTPIAPISTNLPPSTLTYTALHLEFDRVCKIFAQHKQQKATQEKREGVWVPRHKLHQRFNRFRTIDQGPADLSTTSLHKSLQHRPRYSFKTRQQRKEHDPPAAMTLYKLKPYKTPPEKPVVPLKPKSKKTPIKPAITNTKKKTILNALDFEHPLTSLDMGTLHTSVRNVHKSDPSLADEVKKCIQGAVREASNVKRRCQQLVGMYLEIVLSYKTISSTDRDILDHLCARLSEVSINRAEEQVTATPLATDIKASASSTTASANTTDMSTSTSNAA
ncbi:hypothetical protein FBU30_003299, partial [Linnemannia zychae]